MRPILALALVLVAMPAGADHCTTNATSLPELDAGSHYVDVDRGCIQLDILCSIWIYEESNGIAGLQRGDEVVDDTCHGMIPADTIVF